MELSPSAHQDTFARDHLPPPDQWPALRFDLPALAYPDRLNCAEELLDRTAARFGGHRPCLHDGAGGTWTYAELVERSNRIARVLVDDLGVVPGTRVLLRGPNTPTLVACWFAVLKAGAVAVATMPLLRAGELRTVVDAARVRLALCDGRYLDELAGVGDAGLRTVAFGGDDDELATLARRHPARFRPVATAADDVALIAFTSGTSGRPKATLHFHRDVLAVADTFGAELVRGDADDVFAGSPPLAFTYGLGGLVVFPMRVGASSVLLESAPPDELFRAVGRHRVTVLFTAPTAYRAALARVEGYELGSLRRCVSAGEALPEEVWRGFHRATGVRIVDGLGSTEMLHVFVSAADDDIRPGLLGRAVPGFRVRVLDETGGPAAPGTPGRLAVQGPTGCRYLADDRQREQVVDGWTLTGDTCVLEPDGYLRYLARCDDMIVTSGYNVAAPEVEQALVRHPAVAECGVVGVPDTERGTLVKAFVRLAPGATAGPGLVAELQAFVKREIAPYKYPRVVEFVDALPSSHTGKLQRHLLRLG